MSKLTATFGLILGLLAFSGPSLALDEDVFTLLDNQIQAAMSQQGVSFEAAVAAAMVEDTSIASQLMEYALVKADQTNADKATMIDSIMASVANSSADMQTLLSAMVKGAKAAGTDADIASILVSAQTYGVDAEIILAVASENEVNPAVLAALDIEGPVTAAGGAPGGAGAGAGAGGGQSESASPN